MRNNAVKTNVFLRNKKLGQQRGQKVLTNVFQKHYNTDNKTSAFSMHSVTK